MPALHFEHLQTYRAMTYYLRPDLRVTTKDQAVDFVNERGFVYFWPIKDVTMPSLWAAVAGDRPVPDEHDDPGHVTWRWKDEMLGARRWYYAKVLRKKATFIALGVVPFFYALSENYGEPEEDYLLQYQEGRMTFEAKTVYETLLKEGPLDSISLRKAARLTSRESECVSTGRSRCSRPTSKCFPPELPRLARGNTPSSTTWCTAFIPIYPNDPGRSARPRRAAVWPNCTCARSALPRLATSACFLAGQSRTRRQRSRRWCSQASPCPT